MPEMIRKAQPTPGDVHVNGPLTNMSVAFIQSAGLFMADQVFPNIPVGNQSDLYWHYDRGYFNRDQMKKRAPGTESAGAGYDVDADGTYHCDVWGLHKDIPDQVRANATSPLAPDREATEFLTQQALINRETQFVTNFFTTSVWTTDKTVSNQWSDYVNSDPIGDVEDGMEVVGASTGFEPNIFALGRPVWGKLKNHPDIIDRIKYGQTPGSPAMVSMEAVAALLEVDRVVVSKAIYNSAAEGATNVHAYIAGKHALLAYAAPSPGLMTPSAGYTFSWNGYLGAAPQGQRISRFRMEWLKADRAEIEMAYDQAKIAADLGYFFSSVVA